MSKHIKIFKSNKKNIIRINFLKKVKIYVQVICSPMFSFYF